MIIPKTDFDLDFLMACRYLYYCRSVTLISDQQYDELEREYELVNGELPVGSSDPASYSPAHRALAMYLVFSGRFVSQHVPMDPL